MREGRRREKRGGEEGGVKGGEGKAGGVRSKRKKEGTKGGEVKRNGRRAKRWVGRRGRKEGCVREMEKGRRNQVEERERKGERRKDREERTISTHQV